MIYNIMNSASVLKKMVTLFNNHHLYHLSAYLQQGTLYCKIGNKAEDYQLDEFACKVTPVLFQMHFQIPLMAA